MVEEPVEESENVEQEEAAEENEEKEDGEEKEEDKKEDGKIRILVRINFDIMHFEDRENNYIFV